jgi:hypothetical protein
MKNVVARVGTFLEREVDFQLNLYPCGIGIYCA